MPIQIGICDDCAEDSKKLSKALYTYDESFEIKDYRDSDSFLKDCLSNDILFDVVFLDIYMPGLNGIETAKKIRSVMKHVIIIFVSSSNEHYHEAYDVFAFNYIIKPVNAENLNHILDQALMNINKDRKQQIQFSYKSINYRICCRDILYIESSNKLVLFHMEDGTTLQCYTKIDEIHKQLPEKTFIRCHQSYVINIIHINEMAENQFRVGCEVISISKKYQKVTKEKYFNYLFTHMNK